jgi:outer membrane protein insertion porin family
MLQANVRPPHRFSQPWISIPEAQRRRHLVAELCIGLVFVGLGRRAGYGQVESIPWGRTVIEVRLESDAHLKIATFQQQIVQKTGEPLERPKVAETLRNLYSTGRFRTLRVDAESRGNGVVLVLVGEATFYLGSVTVDKAPKALSPRALESAAGLRVGEPLSDEPLAAATQRIKTMLAENAYYEAQVGHTLSRDLDNQVAGVNFSVAAGRPARLSQVEFGRVTGVANEQLTRIARWKMGTQLTAARLERGRTKINDFYSKQGYLEASTSVVGRSYDPQNGTEKLTVRVEVGPLVRVHVRGADISSRKLKQLLPLYRDGQTDDLALESGQRKLRDYLQKQGYFQASVKWQRDTRSDPPTIDVTYIVDRGAQGDFIGFALKGNQSISNKELLEVLSLQPRAFPRQRGVFSDDLLDHDVKALTAVYQAKGFLDVHVTPKLGDPDGDQPNNLFVTFDIEEGPLARVGRLEIRGVDPEMQSHLESLLSAKAGQPYSPALVDSDRDSILSYLTDQGYNQAKVVWNASPPSPEHKVDLQYQIDPGLQQKIQGIVLVGNEYTRTGLVNRQLTIAPGQWLSQGELLESQRRLYDLGLFNQVQIVPEDPGKAEAEETVLVSMEEAKRWTLGYGFGLDVQALANAQPQGQYQVSPRASLDITRINVGGRDQTFSIHGRYSDIEKGGSASYSIPNVGGLQDYDLSFTASAGQYRDVLTFNSKREEVAATLLKRYGAGTTLQGQYSFRNVEVSNLQINPLAVPLFSQPVHVASVGLLYTRDHRDNPIDSTKGSFSSATGGVAWQGLGSQTNFVRFGGQNSTYYRLNPHVILARNTRVGVETPFGPLLPTTVTVTESNGERTTTTIYSREIPLAEHFFMGGPESHRGFSFDQAGPRDLDTGYPIGGGALFLNSVELRFPFRRNKYGLVLFDDAGNVFSTPGRMHLLKFTQTSPVDFDYMVNATGLGVRYNTPVGPLRLDVAYTYNPTNYTVCNLSPLPAVCPVSAVEVRTLPRFVFSFGIGQSF